MKVYEIALFGLTNAYLSICFFQLGHTKKSCPVWKAEVDPDSISDDDKLFWSYVAEEERPATMLAANFSDDEDEVEGEQEGLSDSSEGELYDYAL